jgi:hypothetical protein
VFCPIDQHDHLSPNASLATASPPSSRRACAGSSIAEARPASNAKAAAVLFSGHSLRAGYATSAAAKELPSPKSAEMVQGYIRESDWWGKAPGTSVSRFREDLLLDAAQVVEDRAITSGRPW